MKRLFIGVPVLSKKAADQTHAWQIDSSLNINRLAWTKPANWHFTLAFLGATHESVVPLLNMIIDQAFGSCPAYGSSINGVGVFPSPRKPNVLWLGIDNIQPLLPFYDKMVELLHHHNFSFDAKPLKPHLTIARVKSLNNRPSFDNLLQAHHHSSFGEVPINSVILYESISTPNGVMYKPLYEKKLMERFE